MLTDSLLEHSQSWWVPVLRARGAHVCVHVLYSLLLLTVQHSHTMAPTHRKRGSDLSLFINNRVLMRPDLRLSHRNVCTPEHTSITDEKVRSDRVERPFYGVVHSVGITGRIESSKSIGRHNREACYSSFLELESRTTWDFSFTLGCKLLTCC